METSKLRSPAARPPGPAITPVGEDALLVEDEPAVSLQVNERVRRLAFALEQAIAAEPSGVIEIVQAYRSLMVYFDPSKSDHDAVAALVRQVMRDARSAPLPAPRRFRFPTVYNSTHGPDLDRVAELKHMPREQVIEMFASQAYPVYCLGFLCCLAYMGGVPEALHVPRLTTPRTFVPAGSVGFANAQCVVLPIDQPSGWHYIGRTFVKLYDPKRLPPTPIRAGDVIEFPAVSEAEARRWAGRRAGDCIRESA